MKIWLDAHISHLLAPWLSERFDVEVSPARDVGHLTSDDDVIFEAARAASAIVMTKDADFVRLVESLGAPPQVIWLTCGNTSNRELREILERVFEDVLELLRSGEPIVEISDAV